MSSEGFHSSFSPSLEPMTHGSFTHAQCRRDVLWLPALFFQVPGTLAPFFPPIGFSWYSHPPSSAPPGLLKASVYLHPLSPRDNREEKEKTGLLEESSLLTEQA